MLKVKKLKIDAKVPFKAKEGDAGWDVFSCENKTLVPNAQYNFGLGLAVEFPDGYVLMTAEKSGMALKNETITMGNIIDSGYRGEIHVLLKNLSQEDLIIVKGQKIAQLLLLRCYTKNDILEVENLSQTERGEGGFGSTGDF